MDYQIVQGRTINYAVEDLVAKVQKLIAEGWEPIGGVAVLPDHSDLQRPRILYQAMTKG